MISRKNYAYGTHLPALITCLMKTEGWVLEQGSGLYSTPVIKMFRRPTVTIERNSEWQVPTQYHNVVSLEEALAIRQKYSVVLVDGPTLDRQPLIAKMAELSEFVVVHDTEDTVYGYDFSHYKYQKVYRELAPWTTIVSNVWDPGLWSR